ncbi:hypothetical protein GGR57DRAFT_485949 [Xylariaceae sp. FL1272]|nr:hypothetical protein GGR57DRAFT_485949 [Xylariaceae sp. FL1272]
MNPLLLLNLVTSSIRHWFHCHKYQAQYFWSIVSISTTLEVELRRRGGRTEAFVNAGASRIAPVIMFATFDGGKQEGRKADLKEENDSEATGTNLKSFDASIRPKRQQVARACDSCRMHRIKCDNNVPCKNCISRGEQCINKGPGERRTLPQAYREIDRLKQKVKELEEQLAKERSTPRIASTPAGTQSIILTPPGSIASVSTPDASCITPNVVKPQQVWGGILTKTGQSPQKTWYGPSSQFYYIYRMNKYISTVFEQIGPDDQIQLQSAAKTFATPDCTPADDVSRLDLRDAEQPVSNEEFLTPSQEEYFLNIFWQSYHPTCVVLDESEFRQHYRSLLTKPGKPRKPSALVDIVIAVSMQVGMAVAKRNSTIIPTRSAEVGKDDPSIAGRLYYRRCQRLLHNEQEAPTLMTVQGHILSAVYTCCAAFQNMCYVALSMAVRSAHMLGLHCEPPSDLPIATQEMRRRLWWTLYAFESKTCMKLGRPFYANVYSTSCSLPAHDHLAARQSGSDFALLDENNTWLTYTIYNSKLLLAARETHTAFYDKYPEFFNETNGELIYNDPEGLERYADFLTAALKPMDVWVDSVPNALRTKRKGNGKSLSTDQSQFPLEIEQFAPLWLQRQRLLLELLYHNISVNLYRPFISFPSIVTNYSPLGHIAQAHAASAARHGVILTQIMHQAVIEKPELLAGFHEAFQWQWNAALALAGYLFAHPNSSIAPSVRTAIDLANVVFEDFGRSFGTCYSATSVMNSLAAKIDFLAAFLRSSEAQPQPQPPSLTSAEAPTTVPETRSVSQVQNELFANGVTLPQDMATGPMDLAYSVDNAGDLNMLWPPIGNMSDQYWFLNQVPNMNGMNGQYTG